MPRCRTSARLRLDLDLDLDLDNRASAAEICVDSREGEIFLPGILVSP